MRGPVGDRALECVLEEGELLRAPYHRRVEVAFVPRRAGRDVEQSERRHRFLLALQRERVDRLDLDGVLHEAEGGFAEEDLPGRGGLLQPGGDVHGVARHESLSGRGVAGHDLAGVHADPCGQALAVLALQIGVQ